MREKSDSGSGAGKMKKRFSTFVSEDLNENLLGKAYAFTQYRKHEQQKAKIVSLSNRIQEKCRAGVQERDIDKKISHLLSSVFDLARALKVQADMSSSLASIETANSLMVQNVRNEIETAVKKQKNKK
jgi:hypothetical protein